METLILIDIQKGFMDPIWGPRSNPQFETNVSRLLDFWRRSKRPLIHIQHLSRKKDSPLRPHQEGAQFMDCAKPLAHEPVITKHVHSAFIGTNLELALKGTNRVVVAGLAADHCVSTTARMACDLGFQVAIPADAVATFDRVDASGIGYPAQSVHAITLSSLHQEFAEIVTVNQLMESLTCTP